METLEERLAGIQLAGLHSDLMIRGHLPYDIPSTSLPAFRGAVERASAGYRLRRFDVRCISHPLDYAELAARFVHAAGIDLEELRVVEPIRGAVELRFTCSGRRLSHSWVQRGAVVHPSFFEALDLLTMPDGRFVRIAAGEHRYLGLYLPEPLASRTASLLGGLR